MSTHLKNRHNYKKEKEDLNINGQAPIISFHCLRSGRQNEFLNHPKGRDSLAGRLASAIHPPFLTWEVSSQALLDGL